MTINQLFENYGYKNHQVRVFFKDADKQSYFGRIDEIPMEFKHEEVNTFFIAYGPDIHLVVEIKKKF